MLPTDQHEVNAFFDQNKPGYVFFAAANIRGIVYRNKYSADILMQNMVMQTNILSAAHKYHTKSFCLGAGERMKS